MSAKPKQDDPAQSKRFVDMAREIEAEESGEAFQRALRLVIPEKKAVSVVTKTARKPRK